MRAILNRSQALAAIFGATLITISSLGDSHADTIDVKMPELNMAGLAGQITFTKYCAACHGARGGGTDKGPPLIHRFYEPNHHGDIAFVRAAKFGVRAHHWRFGNMPPVEGIGDDELLDAILFVREVQQANGIR